MILIRLNGGLGNQLFQYAMGRRASIKANLPLYLDTEKYDTCTLRKYSLAPFNIAAQIATKEDKQRLHIYRKKDPIALLHALLDKIRPLHKRRIIREPNFRFQPQLLQLRTPAYLDGDWQTPKYFQDITESLRYDLTLKNPLDPQNQEFTQTIQNTPDSISLHIRRGDLANDPHTHQTHGTLSLDYYQHALQQLLPHLNTPHIYLFSDDPTWAKANLKTPDIPLTPIDHNPPQLDYADLYLMSLCQHHIIANSTFSWWAAWLSPNPNKKIHYPQTWFRAQHHNTTDLFPNSWTPIP